MRYTQLMVGNGIHSIICRGYEKVLPVWKTATKARLLFDKFPSKCSQDGFKQIIPLTRAPKRCRNWKSFSSAGLSPRQETDKLTCSHKANLVIPFPNRKLIGAENCFAPQSHTAQRVGFGYNIVVVRRCSPCCTNGITALCYVHKLPGLYVYGNLIELCSAEQTVVTTTTLLVEDCSSLHFSAPVTIGQLVQAFTTSKMTVLKCVYRSMHRRIMARGQLTKTNGTGCFCLDGYGVKWGSH